MRPSAKFFWMQDLWKAVPTVAVEKYIMKGPGEFR